MSEPYKKTAKDIAWDKERKRLGCIIKQLQQSKQELQEQLERKDRRISELETQLKNLLEVSNLSEKDIEVLIENKKKQNEAADTLIRLAHLAHMDMF